MCSMDQHIGFKALLLNDYEKYHSLTVPCCTACKIRIITNRMAGVIIKLPKCDPHILLNCTNAKKK